MKLRHLVPLPSLKFNCRGFCFLWQSHLWLCWRNGEEHSVRVYADCIKAKETRSWSRLGSKRKMDFYGRFGPDKSRLSRSWCEEWEGCWCPTFPSYTSCPAKGWRCVHTFSNWDVGSYWGSWFSWCALTTSAINHAGKSSLTYVGEKHKPDWLGFTSCFKSSGTPRGWGCCSPPTQKHFWKRLRGSLGFEQCCPQKVPKEKGGKGGEKGDLLHYEMLISFLKWQKEKIAVWILPLSRRKKTQSPLKKRSNRCVHVLINVIWGMLLP